jgi:hypothetical protein
MNTGERAAEAQSAAAAHASSHSANLGSMAANFTSPTPRPSVMVGSRVDIPSELI